MRASSEITGLAGADVEHEVPREIASGLSVEEMYRRHAHMVRRRAWTILGSRSEALDVAQQVFLGLLDDPGSFDGRSAITTWLYRVTTNLCLNRLRDGQNRTRLLQESRAPDLAAHQHDASSWVMARQLLDRMPDDLAQATVYHAIDGMTQAEIAVVLGCSRRHVGHLLERAIEWARSTEEVAR